MLCFLCAFQELCSLPLNFWYHGFIKHILLGFFSKSLFQNVFKSVERSLKTVLNRNRKLPQTMRCIVSIRWGCAKLMCSCWFFNLMQICRRRNAVLQRLIGSSCLACTYSSPDFKCKLFWSRDNCNNWIEFLIQGTATVTPQKGPKILARYFWLCFSRVSSCNDFILVELCMLKTASNQKANIFKRHRHLYKTTVL